MPKLYDNIKKRRLELGMTQTELAQAVGYSDKSAIAHIESGRTDLTQSKVEAFARALRTTPGSLMGWEEDEPLTDVDRKRQRMYLKLEKAPPDVLDKIDQMIDIMVQRDVESG